VTDAGYVPAPVDPTSPALPHPTGPHRARPVSTSLDTGQQIDIGRSRLERDIDRIHRYDRSKAELAGTLGEAAAARFRIDDDRSGVVLDGFAKALRECRGGDAYRDAGCGAYLVRPRSCHVRLCPDCERSRSSRFVHRLAELVDAMARPVFWTFTIPNVPRGELVDGIDVLLEAFRGLRRRAMFAGGACREQIHATCTHPRRHRADLVAECRCGACTGCRECVHREVAGGVYSIEVTWNAERGDWHPHLHALMDAPYIRWAELRDAWRGATCDAVRKAEARAEGRAGRIPRCSHPADAKGLATDGCRGASVVWVEAVKGEPGSDERARAIRETLKYVSKGLLAADGSIVAGAGAAELAELVLAIRSRRLVAGWGSFRNVHDDEDDGLDPAEYLVGDDVMPALRGLPRVCPACRLEALWELPVHVPRRACRPLGQRWLTWRPPGPGRVQ